MKKLNCLFTKKAKFLEIETIKFWYKLALLANVTQRLNILQTNLQRKNKLFQHMANKILAFVEKLKIYMEEVLIDEFKTVTTKKKYLN